MFNTEKEDKQTNYEGGILFLKLNNKAKTTVHFFFLSHQVLSDVRNFGRMRYSTGSLNMFISTLFVERSWVTSSANIRFDPSPTVLVLIKLTTFSVPVRLR